LPVVVAVNMAKALTSTIKHPSLSSTLPTAITTTDRPGYLIDSSALRSLGQKVVLH
jgi:hypothetical protein